MDTDVHYLYLIVKDCGSRYIGVSTDPKNRFKQHLTGRGNPYLINSNSKLFIIDSGEKDYIYNLEIEYIEELKPELNRASGGQGGFTGNYALGENHGNSKLTTKDIIDIIDSFNEGCSIKELADLYSISYSCCNRICNRKSWKHIDKPVQKISKEKLIDTAKALKNKNVPISTIAELLGVHRSTVYNYINK